MELINNYITDNKDKFVNELIELLKIPSVSADPAYKNDVAKTAEVVKQSLIGRQGARLETGDDKDADEHRKLDEQGDSTIALESILLGLKQSGPVDVVGLACT